MRTRFTIILGVLVVVFGAGRLGLTFSRGEPEPTYGGKPLRDWLISFDAPHGTAEYNSAENAIRLMGTNALPTLIRCLRKKDPPFHNQWINLLAKLHLLHGRVDYAMFTHRRAGIA